MFGHPIHPVTVHFPIAFYILGVGLILFYLWRTQPEVERFAAWCFRLSLAATLIAAIFGLIDQNQLAVDDPRQVVVNNHITASVALLIINGLLVYLRLRWPDVLRRYRRGYLGLMALGLIAVLTAGWLGGELVFGLNVGR